MLLVQSHITKILYLLIFLLFLCTRLNGLGTDIANSDSIRWHRRSTNFLSAIKQGDYINTYQRYHPGVTLMISNSVVKELVQTYELSNISQDSGITIENSTFFPAIHKFSKVFQVFILFVLFGIQLFLISRVFDKKISLIYGLILSLEPYVLGIDRWFHLTSFESYFAFTSLLTLLHWKKVPSNTTLIAAALFFAFGILSKVTVVSILPVLFFVIIARSKCSGLTFSAKKSILFFVFTSLLIFILFPALWIDVVFVYQKIMNGIVGGVSEDVRAIPLQGFSSNFYYLIILALKLSPITLVLFPVSLLRGGKIKNKKFVLLYLLTYLAVLSISSKKIDRYIIPLIPPIALYVSFYVSKLDKAKAGIIVGAYLLFFVFVKDVYYPVYSAYYSPIVGERSTKWALESGYYNNSGEYFAQAALTLNNLVDDPIVWVPFNRDSFNFYFKRDTVKDYQKDVQFAVVSLDHLEDVQDYCSEVIYKLGTTKEPVVYILNCR